MKTAKDLTREQLERIVDTAQRAFWQSENEDGSIRWDPDTEWSWERVEEIAGPMIDAGLRPSDENDLSHEEWRRINPDL